MKNLLEFIVIHLVNHPEDVEITEEADDRGVVLTIHTHPEDIGRIIGKNGSVIHSIRNICKIRAVKEGIAVRITIAQPEESAEEVTSQPEETIAEAEDSSVA